MADSIVLEDRPGVAGEREPRIRQWTARMVQPETDKGVGAQSPYLQKEFAVSAPRGTEQLSITAFGLYRCFINGQRVGSDLLTPGWTAYDKRLAYQTYDVGPLLKQGKNTIEIWLGDGWYRSPMMWPRHQIVNTWGSSVAAMAELRASSAPDAEVLLATDASWRSGLTPIVRSGIYFGEAYDARQEHLPPSGGSRVLRLDLGVLVPQETTPVHALPAIVPVRSWRDPEGRTVYDFGQNLGGYVAFSVKGKAGARVLVEHAEILDRDGVFDRSSVRSAEARTEYTLKGGAAESYRPAFSFQGFRYARVAIEGGAEIVDIESVPISSVGERTASFTSANPLVNRLVENTVWSQRSNFIDVPTDCPQRDERLGWTGDAQVFSSAACYLNDSETFFRKWLRDVIADQRADGGIAHVVPDPTRLHPDKVPGFYGSSGWGDAICVVPWVLWTHYGDRAVLEETVPAMARWVDFLWSISDGPIVRPPRHRNERGATFGDWLQPGGPSEKPLPTCGDDMAATLYLYISSTLAAKAAAVIGDKATEARMSECAERVKKAFAQEFVTPRGRLVYDDQTSYALAILNDLIPPEHLAAASRYFKEAVHRADNRIGTGFIGTPALLPALVKIGEAELAATVFLQEDTPGWLYQVKTGATTIWERWDAILPDGTQHSTGMNSFNHYAYGAVCQWLFEAVAGFRPDPKIPGFRHVIFEPTIIPALSPVGARHASRAGEVSAAWEVADGAVTYRIEVPADAFGTLVLSPDYTDVRVDGQTISASDGETTRHILKPGQHVVTFRLGKPKQQAGS